jgi:hypothetical protein
VINTTTTALDGSYSFNGLTPGSYTVAEVEQAGWTRTAPAEGSYTVELTDADVTGRDFGNHGVSSISGAKFFDTNGNGARADDGLSGLDNRRRARQFAKPGGGPTSGPGRSP